MSEEETISPSSSEDNRSEPGKASSLAVPVDEDATIRLLSISLSRDAFALDNVADHEVCGKLSDLVSKINSRGGFFAREHRAKTS